MAKSFNSEAAFKTSVVQPAAAGIYEAVPDCSHANLGDTHEFSQLAIIERYR
jgi:hypothetical protein